jgi:hypothetical protein
MTTTPRLVTGQSTLKVMRMGRLRAIGIWKGGKKPPTPEGAGGQSLRPEPV